MAGPIQGAMSNLVTTASTAVAVGKKMAKDEKQVSEKASAQAKAEEEAGKAIEQEAKDTALETDLIKMGADPESAKAFMNARSLGLDTQQFGMIRKKGKFVGTYSSLAEKLSKDSLTDSLSSKVINDKGFAERVVALGNTRRGRVDALVKASEGSKK